MYFLEGKLLPLDQQFFHNNIRYPSNWLRLSTQADRDRIGIVWKDELPRPDDYFYVVTDNGDGTFNAVPRDVDEVKADMIFRTKQSAGALLALSDWQIIRQQETGKPVDSNVAAYRVSVRVRSDEIESDINSCKTIEELISVNMVFSP